VQIRSRSLHPDEINHELIWLAVSIASIAFGGAWLWIGLPWPRCAFHDLTGHPCLTCGMTRSAIRFFHGDFIGALRWNPLIFAALCALTVFDVYAVVVLTTGARRFRLQLTIAEKRMMRVLGIVLLLANWVYLLSRPAASF
jgi:Protein of unknown function (DUF2752)